MDELEKTLFDTLEQINGIALTGDYEYQTDDNNGNLIDVIMDVKISDDVYFEYEFNEKEFPRNQWTLWVSQNDYDRENNQVSMVICNENSVTDLKLNMDDKQFIRAYLMREGIDTEVGILLNEATQLL